MADKLAEECFTSDPGGTEEALGTDAGVGIGEQTPRSEPIEIVTVLKPARAYDQAPARASATDDMVAGNVYQQSPWGERYVQPISGGKQAQETVIEASETTIEGRDSSENGENGETRERTGSLLLSQVVARMSDTDSTDYGLGAADPSYLLAEWLYLTMIPPSCSKKTTWPVRKRWPFQTRWNALILLAVECL